MDLQLALLSRADKSQAMELLWAYIFRILHT